VHANVKVISKKLHLSVVITEGSVLVDNFLFNLGFLAGVPEANVIHFWTKSAIVKLHEIYPSCSD